MTKNTNRYPDHSALRSIGGAPVYSKAEHKGKAAKITFAGVAFLGGLGLFAKHEMDVASANLSQTQIETPGQIFGPTTASGLNETMIDDPSSKLPGKNINVYWSSDSLSNFAKDLIQVTPSAGASTAEKVLAVQNQAEIVTGTTQNDGAIQADTSVEMRVPQDANIKELNQLESTQGGTKITLVK